jgi:hypothetical protein
MQIRQRCRGGNTKSTHPLCTALTGIPLYLADASSWAKVMPPAALISAKPCEPSEPSFASGYGGQQRLCFAACFGPPLTRTSAMTES